MTDLLDLPEEVLSHIISQLDVAVFYGNEVFTTKHWPSLFNLSLSCQQLCRIVRPHIFKELTFIASANIDPHRSRLERYLESYENVYMLGKEVKAVRLFDTDWLDSKPPERTKKFLKILILSSSLAKLQLSLYRYKLLHDYLTRTTWSRYWDRLANHSYFRLATL